MHVWSFFLAHSFTLRLFEFLLFVQTFPRKDDWPGRCFEKPACLSFLLRRVLVFTLGLQCNETHVDRIV